MTGTMSANQSIKDMNMMYLDVASGIGGLLLFTLIKYGPNELTARNSKLINGLVLPIVFFVLLARVFTDFIVDKTKIVDPTTFGGSTEELMYSMVMWVVLVMLYTAIFLSPRVYGASDSISRKFVKLSLFGKLKNIVNGRAIKHMIILLLSTLIMLFAIARVTNWA